MKKVMTVLLTLVVLSMSIVSISADEYSIMPCGATCPSCGQMTCKGVNYYTYTGSWATEGGDQPCIHGKSGYYDPIFIRWVKKVTRECSNCGWNNEFDLLEKKVGDSSQCYKV